MAKKKNPPGPKRGGKGGEEDWKAKKDRARYRKLRPLVDLKGVLREIFGDWDVRDPQAKVWALAAWRRLDRARSLGRHGLPKRDKHAAFALLKGLVGEGYLRPEPHAPPPREGKALKGAPDPVLARTAYRPTRKAKELLGLSGGEAVATQGRGGDEG